MLRDFRGEQTIAGMLVLIHKRKKTTMPMAWTDSSLGVGVAKMGGRKRNKGSRVTPLRPGYLVPVAQSPQEGRAVTTEPGDGS